MSGWLLVSEFSAPLTLDAHSLPLLDANSLTGQSRPVANSIPSQKSKPLLRPAGRYCALRASKRARQPSLGLLPSLPCWTENYTFLSPVPSRSSILSPITFGRPFLSLVSISPSLLLDFFLSCDVLGNYANLLARCVPLSIRAPLAE